MNFRRLHGDDDGDQDESAVAARVTSIFVLWAVAFGGYSAALLVKGKDRYAALLGSMAAGVMVSGGLVHLLPESVEDLSEFSESDLDGYPLAGLLAGISFILLVVVDMSVHRYLGMHSHIQTDPSQSSSEVQASPSPSPSQGRSTAQENVVPGPSDQKASSGEDAHDHGVHQLMKGKFAGRAVLVSVAINFHAVLSGLALGTSSASSTWQLLGAIAFHKVLEAVALGSAVLRAHVSSRTFFVYGGIFSLCTPIGIGLGWASTALGDDEIGSGVCNALAAGTFIWVAVAEFLPQAFKAEEDFFWKIAALSVGFTAMSVVAVWA